MTHTRLMSEMGSRELSEWMAYNEIEPFGPWRDDLRMGILAATVANTGFGRPDPPVQAADFIPDFLGQDDTEPTEAEQAEKVRANFEMLRLLTGGKHIHRGEVVEE